MKMFRHARVVSIIVVTVLMMMISIPGAWAQEAERVNINTASVEELVKLDGIGPNLAARIVAYREASGRFEKPGDITKVKGIGEKAFDVNRDRIVVE